MKNELNKSAIAWKYKNLKAYYWLSIPVEWYNYFNKEDFDFIKNFYNRILKDLAKLENKFSTNAETYPHEYHRQRRRLYSEADYQKRTFRKILRARRAKTFREGTYYVRTSSVWFEEVSGPYNALNVPGHWESRPKKHDVVTWVSIDELNRHIFMFKNKIFAVSGSSLDGLSKI